jgi:hypothetical protein
VQKQALMLQSFYLFKKRYELILIPMASAIGVFLTFKLYVPGGIEQHPQAALTTFVITIASCFMAIFSENKKSFEQPIRELRVILEDLKRES